MNVESFWKYWGLRENPFKAEEARDDDVYRRIMADDMTHPDFEKIMGLPDRPTTSVVFGEKGSGKTAIRLLIEKKINAYNASHPDQQTWLVGYDELNPVLDRLERHPDGKNFNMRLVDHQDAILSLSVTRLIDQLVGDEGEAELSKKIKRTLRRSTTQRRIDLAILAALYDQPSKSSADERWRKVKNSLGVGVFFSLDLAFWMSAILLAAAVGGWVAMAVGMTDPGTIALTVLLTFLGCWSSVAWVRKLWFCGGLARRIGKEMRVVDRAAGTLKKRLGDLSQSELAGQSWPVPGDQDSRYEWTVRFMRIIEPMGYAGMIVLMDRVDEPVRVNGDAEIMQKIVWPMINNKFLQQDRVGFKLLLPMELGRAVKKESSDFYQQARLDKQNMIERLEWTGSTLYDICSRRMLGCRDTGAKIERLSDLFAEDVRAEDVIDALDQMSQPRDAFKFMYKIVQEHCQNTSEDTPVYRIPKLVLDHIRKMESLRMRDLQRGYAPA